MKTSSLAPIFILLVIDAMGFGLVIPVLGPLIMDPNSSLIPADTSIHMRHIYVSLLLAIFPSCVLIGTPLLGLLSDRIGRRKVLLSCLSFSILGLILAGVSISQASIFLLLLARCLSGLSSASQPLAQAAVVDMSTAKTKALNMSLVAFAMTLGMLAGPLMGGFLSDSNLISWFNLSTPFYASALLSIFNLLLMIIYFAESNQHQTQAQWSLKNNIKNCLAIFRQKSVLVLISYFLLFELAWSLYFQAVPLLLSKTYHYNSEMIAIFITYLGLSMSFGLSIVFRILVKYLSLENMISLCFITGFAGLLLCLLFTGEISQWIFSLPLTIAIGIGYTAVVTVLSNTLPKELQGWLMGLCAALLALAWALTGYAVGVLLELSDNTPLIISAVFLVGGTALSRKGRRAWLNLLPFN